MSTLILGDLPVGCINRTLQMELEAGKVVVTSAAQKHVQSHHPKDYSLLLPHIATVVLDPLYIGDDLRNPGKIELIKSVPGLDQFALVAVAIERDGKGQ
jgi:hypothetical protein